MSLSDTIANWVVNDYFTPNIKAEVILDTLLTDYAAEIIKAQCGDKVDKNLHFVTKEMSLLDESKPDNTGAKIDYILSDSSYVYLVELKTTNGSIEPNQARNYIERCVAQLHSGVEPKLAAGKSFGEVLGNKLLSIMAGERGQFKSISIGKEKDRDESTLKNVFFDILAFKLYQKNSFTYDDHLTYAENAKRFIKERKWAINEANHTRKYLYTMGQILDEIRDHGALWKKELKLIYLTPCGSLPYESYLDYDRFYIHPNGCGSVSLCASVPWLRAAHPDDECAQLLANTIAAIYLPEMEEK